MQKPRHRERLCAAIFLTAAGIIWLSLGAAVFKAGATGDTGALLHGIVFCAMFPALIGVMLIVDRNMPSASELLRQRAEHARGDSD